MEYEDMTEEEQEQFWEDAIIGQITALHFDNLVAALEGNANPMDVIADFIGEIDSFYAEMEETVH